MEQRLQKALAAAGIASRRRAEELITAGRVTVNGEVVTAQGTNVDLERDTIVVDGTTISVATKRHYIALHKPVGYVSTVSDPNAPKKVVDLVQIPGVRLVPVGRLDADSEGLLLLSDDGDFVFKVTHPSQSLGKTYLATVRGRPDADAVDRLSRGLKLGDGYVTAPAGAKLVGRGPQAGTSLVELVLHEGRYRQVRRMLDTIGHPVIRLVRTRVGPVLLGTLQVGEWRHLTENELRMIAEGKNAPDTEPQEEQRRGERGYYEEGERRPIERKFVPRSAHRDASRRPGPRPQGPPGGYAERPAYDGGGRPFSGNRQGPDGDRRPSFGGGRPAPGNRRPGGDDRGPQRPPFGGDRGPRPPYSGGGDRGPQGPPRRPIGGDGPRPSFGGDRGPQRPSFGGDRGPQRPSFNGGDRGSRPSFGGDRGPRPAPGNGDGNRFGGDRGPRPPYSGGGDRGPQGPPRRPMGGDGPRPSFGGGSRPPQGGRPPAGGGRPPQRPGGGRPPQGGSGPRPPFQGGGRGPRPPYSGGGDRGPQGPPQGGNRGGDRPPYRP